MLQASDELRHAANADPNWRESVYFNFNDSANRIGGWIYLWLLPNHTAPTGMLVSFYRGSWPALNVTDLAMAAPRHLLHAGDDWLYCFKRDSAALIDADFDDVSFAGLQLRRGEPLKRYSIRFDDGEGCKLELECRFMTPPYDYADGVCPTPPWMAANRYHRAWHASGALAIPRQCFDIECTGDSDHSWGQRDMSRFGDNLFKMWSFQTSDGRLAASILKQGVGAAEVPLGFVSIDGVMASVASVEAIAKYDANGVQHGASLSVRDELDRRLHADFDQMRSYLGFGTDNSFWGFEGVGDYQVRGYDSVPGLISYFWPGRITPMQLHAGRWK